MSITTLSSREFNQDIGRAKRAAHDGPVIVTDRGKPVHVLLSFDEYQRITGRQESIVDHQGSPQLGRRLTFRPERSVIYTISGYKRQSDRSVPLGEPSRARCRYRLSRGAAASRAGALSLPTDHVPDVHAGQAVRVPRDGVRAHTSAPAATGIARWGRRLPRAATRRSVRHGDHSGAHAGRRARRSSAWRWMGRDLAFARVRRVLRRRCGHGLCAEARLCGHGGEGRLFLEQHRDELMLESEHLRAWCYPAPRRV